MDLEMINLLNRIGSTYQLINKDYSKAIYYHDLSINYCKKYLDDEEPFEIFKNISKILR